MIFNAGTFNLRIIRIDSKLWFLGSIFFLSYFSEFPNFLQLLSFWYLETFRWHKWKNLHPGQTDKQNHRYEGKYNHIFFHLKCVFSFSCINHQSSIIELHLSIIFQLSTFEFKKHKLYLSIKSQQFLSR